MHLLGVALNPFSSIFSTLYFISFMIFTFEASSIWDWAIVMVLVFPNASMLLLGELDLRKDLLWEFYRLYWSTTFDIMSTTLLALVDYFSASCCWLLRHSSMILVLEGGCRFHLMGECSVLFCSWWSRICRGLEWVWWGWCLFFMMSCSRHTGSLKLMIYICNKGGQITILYDGLRNSQYNCRPYMRNLSVMKIRQNSLDWN